MVWLTAWVWFSHLQSLWHPISKTRMDGFTQATYCRFPRRRWVSGTGWMSESESHDDVYPRETPPHIRTARASPQRHTAAGTAAPPPQTWGTQSHSAPTPLKRPMLTPEGGPRPRVKRLGTWTLLRPQKGATARIVPKGTTASRTHQLWYNLVVLSPFV